MSTPTITTYATFYDAIDLVRAKAAEARANAADTYAEAIGRPSSVSNDPLLAEGWERRHLRAKVLEEMVSNLEVLASEAQVLGEIEDK